MMVKALRSDDHCVFQAYDGLAALELTMGLKNIDLLITNTRMPGLDGPALIREVRGRLPNLPILYIQNQGQASAPHGLPSDVPTLKEPFGQDQLLAMVRKLLQG